MIEGICRIEFMYLHYYMYQSYYLYNHMYCFDQTQLLGPCLERVWNAWNHRKLRAVCMHQSKQIFLDINFYMYCHKCDRGRIKGTSFQVVLENEELVEISFTRKWDSSLKDHIAPINVDKRYLIYICGSAIDIDLDLHNSGS